MKIRGASLLCSIAWLLSACGSAASYDYDLPTPVDEEHPMLARMRGKTVGDTDADSSRLRIALLWFPVSPADGKVQSSQSVKPSWTWGNVFEADISREPPQRAIEGMDMMRYGQAEVVLYEDRDGDDELDLVTHGLESSDRIIGRANGVRVWWLPAGSPAPANDRGYKPVSQGLSVTYGPITEPGDCAPDREMGGSWRPVCTRIKEPAHDLSDDVPFIVPLSDDPKLQSYACLGYWGTSPEKSDEWSDTTPGWNSPETRKKICNPKTCDGAGTGGPLDLPVAGRNVQIQCNPQKTAYVWKDCEPDPKLCDTVFCHVGRGARDPDLNQPPPANWPSCD